MMLYCLFMPSTVSEPRAESCSVVPSGAVVLGDDGARVWKVDDGNRAHSVPVEVGRTWNGSTLVKSGLSEGDRVVSAGAFKLKEGAAVVCHEGNEAR